KSQEQILFLFAAVLFTVSVALHLFSIEDRLSSKIAFLPITGHCRGAAAVWRVRSSCVENSADYLRFYSRPNVTEKKLCSTVSSTNPKRPTDIRRT
uniref:Uncharacterized protein n=1 Tax=Sinocyclocheilus anshuiensis TaxID=1608454 RepID=A0A671KQ28_9TELE